MRPDRILEDVVTQHHAEAVISNEVARKADGVGDAQRATLIAVGEVQAEVMPVGQQLYDVTDAAPAEDDHDLADAHSLERL